MADPQLDKFFKEAAAARAAKAAKPVATAPKPPALSASPAAPVKVAKEAEERSAPSAEPVTPSAEDVKKAEKMRADLLEELPLEDFYKEAARVPLTDIAVESYARKTKLPVDRFTSLAGAQGIDVEDMAQKAREGVPFAEYRRTRDGVIGFKPAAERFTELDRVASDYQTAERGEAPQRTIGIQKAQETTTSLPVFGEGYEVGGTTPDEIIETTKPGEHQYSIAAQFIDSFEKANPEVVSLTDMYGQNAGPGNTQKWIEKYVKMQVRNRGLTAASEDIDEQMGKLRRDAVYYILSKKTIGQWTPGVFVKDVQITDAERAKPLGTGEGFGAGVRDTFAAMAPNVEIVGFNNKGQAVVRQESPAGTALRLLDVLGVSPVGKVKGVPVVIPGQSAISGLITKDKDEGYLEAALRGVQTGATFIDAALDETKGRSTPVRAAAGLAALVPTVLYPDVTGAAEGAYTAAKAYRRVLQDRKIAKAAAPLLDELVAALKAGDYEKATKVESAIRSHPELSKGNHGVMQAQMSMDAQVAEKLKAMNPELASLTPTLGDELITVGVNQSPELAEAIYGEAVKGYPFLHFSKKAPELAARSEKEGIGPTLEAYVNSGDFGRHFQRIERAKAAFLKAAPKNSAEAIDQAVSGLAANLRAKSADVLRLGGAPAADAPRYDRLAKLLEDNKAAIIADPKAAFGKDGVLRQAIKADPVVGADDAREFRAAFYPQAARLSGRIEALKTVDFNTLYQNDLKVFDRAREAVEANIKSRMMAAELLKRELGTRAKINVVPTEILDDLMEPGTERLSAFATAKFIQTMQQLPKAADRKAWLAAFQTMDKMLRGAAELRGVPVDTYWRSIDIRVVDGKPVFVKGEDVVSAPKGPGPLDGFVDVADVQTAVARLRGALAGTDPSYRLKSLLRADGSQAGGEVAVGDVVVRAIRSPQPGAPYRVEVFVGAQQKAAFTSTGKLEDAINEGIDEAQNAMTGRVAAGEPAMREVVVPKPPKTAAQAAAQTSPADAAEEAAAVDSVAATPPAAPLHPKTETVVGGLDPALKADPDVVSRILAAVDKLKAGSKLPPPPKGANKVLMGAVREELLKSGVLVKLDDGSVVKAGTLPEDVKVAPTAAPTAPPVTPAPAPVASAFPVKAVEPAPATKIDADAPAADRTVRVAPALTDKASLQAYNQSIRAQDTGAGISLDRDTLAAGDNIMYRPDRAYRFIGDAGFKDFEATGLVRAKQDTKAGYEVPYFMTGKTSGRYAARRGRPEYVVEMPITSEWRGGGDYVHPPADPKRTDGIRVFKREADGSYTVILDNIGDQALLTQKTAAEAEAPVFQRVAEEVAPPPEETLEELTARLSRAAEDLRAAEIRAEEEFAAELAERERAFVERMRAREAAPPAAEVVAEPVIQRAPAAAEEPLPAVRKAKGFRDKNSLNAGVYEVDIGGKTRRFFRDSKEGFYPGSFVEDVPTSTDVPVLPFLGDTIEDAVKALQRTYGAEEVPAAARAAEEVVAEAAPAVERAVDEAEQAFVTQRGAAVPERSAAAEEYDNARRTGSGLAEAQARIQEIAQETQRNLEELQARVLAQKEADLARKEEEVRRQAEFVRRQEETAQRQAERRAKLDAEFAEARARRITEDAARRAQIEADMQRQIQEGAARYEAERAAREEAERVAREAAQAEKAARDAKLKEELELKVQQTRERVAAEQAAREAEAAARKAAAEAEATKRVAERQREAAAEREAARAETPRLADLEDRFPEARPGNLKDVLREVREWTPNESYKRIIDRLLEQGGRFDEATFSVAQVGDSGEGFGHFGAGALGIAATQYDDPTALIRVHMRGTSVGRMERSLDEVIVHEALHAAADDRLSLGLRRSAAGTRTGDAAAGVLDLRDQVVREIKARLGDADELAGVSRNMIAEMVNKPHELIAYGMTHPEFQALLKTIKVEQNKSLWTKFVESVAKLLGIAPGDESALAALIERTERILDLTPEEIEATRVMVFPGSPRAPARAVEATPVAKAEEAGTRTRIQELEAEVERLEPFTTATPKRTNVKKDSFTVEIAGKKIRLENDGDSWLDVATGSELGETADGAVGLLRERLVDYPYARAQRELSSLRRTERAAAETKAAEEAVSAAPTQPSGITPVAEAPVVREEIVAPPAPPVKAEPTVDELQATVARLEPLRDAPIKRTNVTKDSFDVEVAGQRVRLERRGDAWFTGTRRLGPNVTEAVESLRSKLIQRPLTKAQDALRKLGQAQSTAATVSSLEDALASVKKIKTRADAKRFFDTARELTLDANEKAQVYENLAQKLEIMAGRAKTERVADEFTDLVTQARDELAAIRPAAETAPSAVAAAADELTEAQRHVQAVTNMRSLTHRAQVDLGVRGNFLMFGGEQNGRFVPVYFINFRASSPPKPAEILESIYNDARLSPQIQEATRRDAEALLEGQTPVVSAFPANKYANDADLKFGSRGSYASINVRREAEFADVDRIRRTQQVDAMIARLYGEDTSDVWFEIPEQFKVNARARLARAEEALALPAGAKGKITDAEYQRLVANVAADLEDQKRLLEAKALTRTRSRGPDWVRSRILAFKSQGVIDEAGADLVDWFIQQNPRIADELGISVTKGGGGIIGGEYTPASRIVTLFKEGGDELTAVHEVLHHTERMLPDALQAAVRKEWARQVTKVLPTVEGDARKLLQDLLVGKADPDKVMELVGQGKIPYALLNPSEFWAVNASRIVSGRYAAFNAGLVAKAKQWLVEFAQKAKAVFGLSSDAPLIRGLDEVLKGDGTFVSRMLSDSGTFKSIEAPTELRQVRPAQAGGPEVVTGAFKPGGGSGLAGTQSIIELAAKTADPTTLLHEGAHFIRKTILDTEDMDNVTAWLNSMGVKVNHEFGEFVGSADDIELAEEMFATAFEKYVVTGKAPTPALERAFELVKNAFAGAYRWMKSDAAKELYGEDALSPQVTAVFNRYFTAVPKKPIESTFDIIVRETRGAKATDAEGALDVLAREATRKGMPKTAREDLVKKIAALKLSDDVPNETVLLEFPAPVLGKTEWTKKDIVGLQAEVVRRRSQMAVMPTRQALFGQPEEEKVTENIYAALAEREEGQLAAGARGVARGMAKLVLGGDIVSERGTRALPEALRRDLDTPARIIETTIGDSVSVLTQSTRDNDPSFMFRFLAGENLRFKSGRRVLSSGHEHITGFFDLYRNQYASMTREEQALLQEWAQLLNTTPNPENLRNPQTISEALASGAFPQNLMNVRNFADLEAQRKAKANAMVAALEKFIDLGGSGEGNIGGQLRKAIKDAAGEGSQIAFNEYRFAEVLLFLSGSTSRRGVRFLPVDKTFTKDQLVEQARVLLTDAQRIYGGEDDPLFSRRLSILVAAYGSSRRAKAELAALGAVLTAEEANAFKNWTLAYNTSPEMSAQLELVKNKFGLNTKFINETILGDNVYVPAQARARMADALAKAQFNNAKLTPTGDLYQKVWTYMKKRMTRGAFALRQRYFFVNTIDHFNQMYLLVGFAPAAASSARLLLQGLPVNVFGQGYETFIRLANRAGMGDRAAMERFRDLLSRGGDELAARIGSALSVSKYRIDVNDILEGRDKLLLVGGNVYTARQLRDTFVAEGIFSSFDTRRLADGVRMDGNIFARELAQISGSPKSSGTFADAASRLMDGVQDVTVDVVDDLSDAWAERERVGAVITLMETGVDARAACRVTVDALYDYSQSMTKRDRSFLVGTVLPFWAFQKNANQQFINVMFSPYGAYRMMALQRLREGSATLASELYYGYIGGELGLDVDNMPQDMQDLYYAIMTRAHEIYGDDLPDNVRIGLRIALTGRVGEVVDGKYYELDTRLIEMMRSGGLAPGGKFGGAGMADYMLAAPNKSGLPSYVRDRFGMVAPQRRNALVRHYTALMGGANEDYFYFMLPESSVETAYKHTATLLGGAFLTAGALSPEWVGIPGVDILAGGADAIGLGDIGRALQPVVDLERSPVMGLALGMYSERGYPQRLHPKVAAALQRMTNIPILRVPAKMDPFMGGTLPDTDEAFRARLEAANAVQDGIVGGTDEAGNPTDLVQILGEDYVRMVQELNSKDLPADVMAVAKEERFYLPPGFMSLSFENSPLGEFNREALRWDQTSKEGADPAGQAAYFTRVLLGTDVVQVAPSRTAQQEEPVRYAKTREPI